MPRGGMFQVGGLHNMASPVFMCVHVCIRVLALSHIHRQCPLYVMGLYLSPALAAICHPSGIPWLVATSL